ncbi:MAG: hypothetical protein M3463_09725 [Verrucomicrobiota bacterium]|nr:hypothetical protein [Verrucomicrobiota bacterium]
MKRLFWPAIAFIAASLPAPAQFAARWLQDDAYWGDGKAEFTIYDAQEVRYGQPRPSEVIHIFVREPFSKKELVKAEPNSRAGTYPVLKLNQVLHIPTGLYVYQQMHSAFWRVDSAALVKSTLTSNDSCGNTYKEFRRLSGWRGWLTSGWTYEWRTYWEGMSGGSESVTAPEDGIFYDELPMRVRTLDFSRPSGEIAFQLASSIIGSKKDSVVFKPAKLKWSTSGEGVARVEVLHEQKTDTFEVDVKPPHLVQSWRKADGGVYRLKRHLKIDYWNYNKPGDKERALGASK